ncbi:MAG: TAT-variant-translocated molybdopterin oxidoreductase [candidate division Zixibacteria bacterium]|nr:TAT-variant-translocated molybdopterin oxidoreductase [candidate division Zixibacteria bacterium]
MRNKLPQAGKEYWRSLEERIDSPEFRLWLEREFPSDSSDNGGRWSRRSFLRVMGASMAFAGLAGCRRPVEKIIPYVKPPEEITPGMPLYYATTMPFGNSAYGLLVESHEGRPTKIEGNIRHPSTRGKSNLQMQAAILDLYDPDRSKSVLYKSHRKEWEDFNSFYLDQFAKYAANDGEGLAVLSEPFSSPTLMRLKSQFEQKFPRANWVAWEPINDENLLKGVELVTGKQYRPLYNYDEAEVIFSLDADLLLGESESTRAAAGFADGRNIASVRDSMNRLYIVESLYSLTGATADHRLALSNDMISVMANAVAAQLRNHGLDINSKIGIGSDSLPEKYQKWASVLAKDLVRTRGRSLIVAGRSQSQKVHALAMHLNDALGNFGKTINFVEPTDTVYPSTVELTRLTRQIHQGTVSTLLILGGNPVYNAPVDLEFRSALKKIEISIHLSSHVDETSSETTWHIPRNHFLESWGDTRAIDGTIGMIQPLIEPLFGGKTDVEVVSLMASGKNKRGYDVVRETWQTLWGSSFENRWMQSLHDGIVSDTGFRKVSPHVDTRRINVIAEAPEKNNDSEILRIVFHPCNTLFDGRNANNGWLQELPDPITKLTWDNVATVSPTTARQFGVKNEDLVKLTYKNNEQTVPVWILPGQADHVIGVSLGYGRTNAGRVGDGIGSNTYRLRLSSALYHDYGISMSPIGQTYQLANVQDHGSMEGRPLIREASLAEYRDHPEFAKEAVEHPPLYSLWEERKYDEGYQWGMAIDLTKCIGCSVCTIACQSENNIPIVGKEETRKGREMHWIRIDRYFEGNVEDPRIVHQPVACHHCENAPCEQVCPVAATVHDKQGLNSMVYNRCIGTRYCANNCPYKVRRFNFFDLTKDIPEVFKMAQNPEVTVRSRGVMEKCTYCVQRINFGKKQAKLEGRQVNDGEIVTACQQACPTDAIIFGNINDPVSRVVEIKKQNREYNLLAELNIKPRTSYLGKLRNPNPEMHS